MRQSLKIFNRGDKKLRPSESEGNLDLSSLSGSNDDSRKLRKTTSSNATPRLLTSDPLPLTSRSSKRGGRERPEAHQRLLGLEVQDFGSLDPMLQTLDEPLQAFLSEVDSRGQTVFHVLIEASRFDVLQYLLLHFPDKRKLDVNVRDKSGWAPLHVACDQGHYKSIEFLLLVKSCDVTALEIDRSTPLHYLIRRFPGENEPNKFLKYTDLVKEMIGRGLDVNARNRWGETVLHKVAMGGQVHVARWLLRQKEWTIELNSANRLGETALHFAARSGNIDMTKVLLEAGADASLSGSNGTPLEVAINSKKEEVAAILKAHTEGNSGGGWKSVTTGDEAVTPRTNGLPSPRHSTSFSHDLIRKNDLEGLQQQIAEKGFQEVLEQIDFTGKTVLHVVCASANIKILRYLLLNYSGISLNVKDRSGMTPLHLACFSMAHSERNLRMVKFLLMNNLCDVNSKAKDGSTAFHYFVRYFYDGEKKRKLVEYYRVGALFLSKGLDINAKNRHGETPLHCACIAGKIFAVTWLLRHGADVNAVTRIGEASLHLAARSGELDVVNALIGLGADVNVEGQNGTPLDVANATQNKEIIDAIAEYVGKTASQTREQKIVILGLDLDLDSQDTTEEDTDECTADGASSEGKKRTKRTSSKKGSEGSDHEGKGKDKHVTDEEKKEKKKKKQDTNDKEEKKKGKKKTNKKKKKKKKKKTRDRRNEPKTPLVQAKMGSSIRELRPRYHLLGRNGDWVGLAKQIREKGIHEVLTTRDGRGQTLLHVAIECGQLEILAKLLVYYPDRIEPDLNLQDRNGWSPLHTAASLGEIDILLMLLSTKRFDATLVSTDGSTPLHYLMRRFPDAALKRSEGAGGHRDTLEIEKFSRALRILIDSGANIRAQNNNSETVLHSAAMAGSAAALWWLLNNEKWSFSINAPTKRGETCLHLAARSGRIKAVRTLLEMGIDEKISGVNGTALDVARKAGRTEVVALLEDYAVNPAKYKITEIDENVVDVVDSLFDSAYELVGATGALLGLGVGTKDSEQEETHDL